MINEDEFTKEWRRKRSVICPHCDHIHDPSHEPEMLAGLITYHGEEPPQEFTCYLCDQEFFVQERVERTFEEKKTMEEFDL